MLIAAQAKEADLKNFLIIIDKFKIIDYILISIDYHGLLLGGYMRL
jgi:hypothetical protein